MSQLFDCREAFTIALENLARQNPAIIAVANDSVGSSKLGNFRKEFSNRLVNVGIAEQNMVGIAAGLANAGKIPFVCAASCFLTARALEQIKVDVAYSNANVKLCGMSPGLAYGELGPTHHSIEDFAWLRAIPNIRVVAPADFIETEQAMYAAARETGPVFMRISRMGVPNIHPPDYQFQFGRAVLLHQGYDLTLIGTGVTTCRALQAAEMLAEDGVMARVLNMATIRPIDEEAVLAAAVETGVIITLEEHTIFGGLGSAVAEVVVANHPVPMRMLGVPGVFAPTGSASWLLDYMGLSPDDIRKTALELVKGRSKQ